MIAAVASVVAIGTATYALAGGNDGNGNQGEAREQGRERARGSRTPALGAGIRLAMQGSREPAGQPRFKDCIKAKKR